MKRVEQLQQILSQRGLLAGTQRLRGQEPRAAIAAQIRDDRAEARGVDDGHDFIEAARIVRKTVQQQNRQRIVRTALLIGDIEHGGFNASRLCQDALYRAACTRLRKCWIIRSRREDHAAPPMASLIRNLIGSTMAWAFARNAITQSYNFWNQAICNSFGRVTSKMKAATPTPRNFAKTRIENGADPVFIGEQPQPEQF